MRPIRLTLGNFTSFRECTVSFEGLSLFAITGPTGAGKSSLLDAIVYALYGRTPRIGDRAVSELVSQGTERMRVDLEFSAGNARYRIFRTYGKTTTIRLEQFRGPDDWELLADRVKEVEQRVKEILGLDFEGFTKAVLLPQGEFDEFLRGDPSTRTRILKQLMRMGLYDRIRKRCDEIDKQLKAEILHLEKLFAGSYVDATAERRQQLERQAAGLEGRRAAAESEIEPLEAVQAEALTLRAKRTQAQETARKLKQARLDVETKARLAQEAQSAVDRLKKSFQEAEDAITRSGYDVELYVRLSAAAPLGVQLDDKRTERKRIGAEIKQKAERQVELDERIGSLKAQYRKLQHLVTSAEAEVEHLQKMHAAGDLRKTLKKGEACPVCEVTVKKVPRAIALKDLDAARVHLPRIRTECEKAARELAALEHERKRLPADIRDLEHGAERVQTSIQDIENQLAQWPDLKACSLAELNDRLRKQTAAHSQYRQAEKKRDEAAAGVRGAESHLTTLRSELAGAEGAMGQLQADQKSLDEELHRLEQSVRGRLADYRPPVDEAAFVEESLKTRRTAQRGLDQELAGFIAQLSDMDRRMQEAAKFRGEIVDKRREQEIHRELALMMQSDRFPGYLQHEALIGLRDAATPHLKSLSSGRYSFRLGEDNSFLVIDHWNADDTRPASTLSGGESFLAALALALALGSLASYCPDRDRLLLDSLFLDEGFSTLDSETLEVVISAVEALSGDNMVGVITHVDELADRLEERIRVVKSAGGSSIIVERGRGAAASSA